MNGESNMAQIERRIVASGIIGQYCHEWAVMQLHDVKYDTECYDLYINKEYIGSRDSIVEALSLLVEQFEE